MLGPVPSGVLTSRSEERTTLASLTQEPPRNTRDEPVAGPVGFDDGLDA
jgi:hypothetical protein